MIDIIYLLYEEIYGILLNLICKCIAEYCDDVYKNEKLVC